MPNARSSPPATGHLPRVIPALAALAVAVFCTVTTTANGGKPPPPPVAASYSMERISQPGWGDDYQIEIINGRGDAAGVTVIKSGRYTLAGEGFFWNSETKGISRLLPLPTSSTGSVVHNATWAGGIRDDGAIIYGASLRSSTDGLVATPHKDFTPVVWINNGAGTLTAINLEAQLLAYYQANLDPAWGFISFSPDFGPTVCNRLTADGDFLFVEGVKDLTPGVNNYVDVVARLDWVNPLQPVVSGMWVIGQRRNQVENQGGYYGNAYSIVEGVRTIIDENEVAREVRVVSVAGSLRSFNPDGTATPESAAAGGSIPMNWELDVETGVATIMTMGHLADPTVTNTTGWGIDVNALGATVGLAKAVGTETSLAYYWEPDGSPFRPAELPGSNNAMRLYAINAAGQAVGVTTTGSNYSSTAILWSAQSNITKTLTSLAGGSVSFEQAVDINERGQIAVLDAAFPSRWYLLTPVATP